MQLKLILLLTITSLFSQAQDFKLADSLFVNIVEQGYKINDTLNQQYYVEYPMGYDKSKQYPVFIGIAGGGQSDKIVRYCYGVYFKTVLLDNYIKIFPVGIPNIGIKELYDGFYSDFLKQIKDNYSCLPNQWLIGGTSNGGIASLEIVASQPALFKGIITMPGIIHKNNITVNNDWKHITALLAYGEKDSPGWIKGVHKTDSVFKANSLKSKILMLPAQGHILKMGFDIDTIYLEYFDLLEDK